MSVLTRRPSPALRARELTDFAYSDVGAVRAANEDALVRRPDEGLWAVADGMGGHHDGAQASAILAAALEDAEIQGEAEADRAHVRAAIQAANRRIFETGSARGGKMGSTIVTLLIADGRFDIAWVGDSRAYLARSGALHPLTRDHTQVQVRVDQGLLTSSEARNHPMAHVLTRAVGSQATVEISSMGGAIQPGDRFLLSSDGVHGVVRDAEIGQALSWGDPTSAGQSLASLCNARGAPDNFTLIIVDCP